MEEERRRRLERRGADFFPKNNKKPGRAGIKWEKWYVGKWKEGVPHAKGQKTTPHRERTRCGGRGRSCGTSVHHDFIDKEEAWLALGRLVPIGDGTLWNCVYF